MNGLTLIIMFLILVFLNCPITFAFLIPSAVYFIAEGLPIAGFLQYFVSNGTSYTILAIPMFIYVGCLMNVSGVSDNLLNFCNVLVGRFRGALAYCNVLTSLLFAGVSGSALADIGGIGKVVMYAMDKDGYSKEDTIGITAASSTIGPIFPPSIPLMIYAMAAEVSSSQMLIAGVIPALLLVGFLCLYIRWITKKHGFKSHELEYTVKEKAVLILKTLPAVLLPAFLIIGLMTGTFGSTALAGISCLIIILIGVIIYRKMNLKKFLEASKEALNTTGNIMFIMCSACVFSRVLTMSRVTQSVAALMLGISSNQTVLLLLSVVFLLVLGMFVDASAAILLATPILLPVMKSVGVDPVHFGVVMVYTLMIGLLTPPVGMSLYMLSDVACVPLNRVTKSVVPYYLPLFVVLLLIIIFPQLTTYLPTLLG